MYNMRIFFSKKGLGRFISHLDMSRAFSRAVLAANIPVRFTEGFNPHPYLVFSQPLPLFFEGEREILDITLGRDITAQEMVDSLNGQLPQGLRAVSAAPPAAKLKYIAAARYETALDKGYAPDFERFWDADVIEIEKKTKRGAGIIDLKGQAMDLKIEPADGCLKLVGILPCGSAGTVSPALIIEAFSQSLGAQVEARYTRMGFLRADLTEFA